MKTIEQAVADQVRSRIKPGEAVVYFARIVAWACVIIGALAVLIGAMDMPRDPGAFQGAVIGFALLISSILWFGIARVVVILTNIEVNTREWIELAKKAGH